MILKTNIQKKRMESSKQLKKLEKEIKKDHKKM